MEFEGTFRPFSEFEAEQLRRGELPDRVSFGAWRPLQPWEEVDPRHIQKVNGVESIPARLYGNAHRTAEGLIPNPVSSASETEPITLVADAFALVRR